MHGLETWLWSAAGAAITLLMMIALIYWIAREARSRHD